MLSIKEFGGRRWVGVRRLSTFNHSLLGKPLYCFGGDGDYLRRRVVGVKYGEAWGQWTTRVVRSTHGSLA